ncbi:MAG: DUF6273 domain-containing protein [Treponema sp.]|nr:DUF6273 domain-containing protein [Treponema sp.]
MNQETVTNCGWWWLRSLNYNNSNNARDVNNNGNANNNNNVNNTNGGVAPDLFLIRDVQKTEKRSVSCSMNWGLCPKQRNRVLFPADCVPHGKILTQVQKNARLLLRPLFFSAGDYLTRAGLFALGSICFAQKGRMLPFLKRQTIKE